MDQWKQAKTQVQDAQNALKAALQSGDWEQIKTATSQFAASLQHLAESGVALKIEIENLKESLKDLDAGDLINKEGILNALDDFGSSLSGAVGRLDDLGNGLYDDSDQLDASLSELSGQMDLLRGEMQDSSQTLREDVRGITDQFQNIFQVLTDAADTEREEPALTQDVSDQDLYKAVDGKVWECSNFGAVDGDLNVGGITGTMAVEVSLDPEDDIMEEGENSFDFQYQTKAILLTCINEGPVQAKKNYAGGIVGRMNVGTVQECEDYGEVRSESGSYVGGIAGFSGSVIRNSFAKAILQGEDQVGGIAGKGTRISGCYGFVELSDAAGQMGAIAGAMDEEESLLEGNYFVDTGWAGIGGISYGGKAEPIAYETLQTVEKVPEKFLKVTLTFLADGQLLSQTEVPFGGSADSMELPEIPEKDGYYGVWPDFKKTDIRYSQTIEADYRPWLTVISSKEGTDVDGKRLAYGLAEGVFRESDVLHVISAQVDAPKDSGEQDSRAIWEVRLEQEEGMSDAYEISLRKPDGKGTLKVWGFQDQWTEIPYEDSKSYVTVSMEGTEGIFCISYVPDRLWIVVAVGAAAAGIGVFVIFKKRRGRRKNSVDL
ncbi:MAG: hypothetical protein ACLTKI_02455 [Lachnospiraceae bacterium]